MAKVTLVPGIVSVYGLNSATGSARARGSAASKDYVPRPTDQGTTHVQTPDDQVWCVRSGGWGWDMGRSLVRGPGCSVIHSSRAGVRLRRRAGAGALRVFRT